MAEKSLNQVVMWQSDLLKESRAKSKKLYYPNQLPISESFYELEFLTNPDLDEKTIKRLGKWRRKCARKFQKKNYEVMAFGSLNYLGLLFILGGVFFAFVCGWILTDLILFTILYIHNELTFSNVSYYIMLPIKFYIAHRVCRLLVAYLPDNPDNFTIYNRKTGLIQLQKTRTKPAHEISFKDFVPFLKVNTTPAGGTTYAVRLANPKTGTMIPHVAGIPTVFLATLYANILFQFMNKELPLPDMPEYEAVRHLDPVTAKWDKENNRDPNYWRSKNKKEIDALTKKMYAKAKKFFPKAYFH